MDKKVLANQPDIVVVDKKHKGAVVIDTAVPTDTNLKKNEYEKQEKYQSLKEELETMWKVKAKAVPVAVETLEAVVQLEFLHQRLL